MAKNHSNGGGEERVPRGKFHAHTCSDEVVYQAIQKEFGDKYGEIFELKDKNGKTRLCYLGLWYTERPSPDGWWTIPDWNVIIKADRAINSAGSDNAQRNMKKGLDTSNDSDALVKARHQHVARLIESRVIPLPNGEELNASVEQYVRGANLQERVEWDPLSDTEFENVFKQTISGVSYIINRLGRYHRDIKPSNIVLGGEIKMEDGGFYPANDRLEVLVTDLANSCPVEDARRRRVKNVDVTDATCGARLVTNPFLFGRFTRQAEAYDDRSEMFSLGSCMYFALTGKYLFDCDRFSGRAIANVAGRGVSLLGEDGKISKEKFAAAVSDGLKAQGIKTKYANIIKNCLLAPIDRGYKTIDNLAEDFDSLTDSTFKKLRKSLARAALPVAAALALVGGGYAIKTGSENIRLRKENTEAITNLTKVYNQKLQAENENERLRKDYERIKENLARINLQVVDSNQASLDRIEGLIKFLNQSRQELRLDAKILESSKMPEDSRQVLIEANDGLSGQMDNLQDLLLKSKRNAEKSLENSKQEEQPQNGN